MKEKEIHRVIKRLKNERKLFHSEDDLKFTISFIIKEMFPNYQIRLEKPHTIEMYLKNGETSNKRVPIDIVLIDEKTKNLIPIELKYKTKKLKVLYDNELFNLTNHGAKDVGRFSFRKDIFRVEQFIKSTKNSNIGFVLIITNDPGYYSQDVSNKNVLDSNFSFHDGATVIKEDRSWNEKSIDTNLYQRIKEENKWKYRNQKKYHWTCIGEKFSFLNLQNDYQVKWQDYSNIEDSRFKNCLIVVNP